LYLLLTLLRIMLEASEEVWDMTELPIPSESNLTLITMAKSVEITSELTSMEMSILFKTLTILTE